MKMKKEERETEREKKQRDWLFFNAPLQSISCTLLLGNVGTMFGLIQEVSRVFTLRKKNEKDEEVHERQKEETTGIITKESE